MKSPIGLALIFSVSLHAVAMTVAFARTHAMTDRNTKVGDSPVFSIQLTDAAPAVPTVASPMVGQGADATAKLEGAALDTKTSTSSDDIAVAIKTNDPQVGDAAAQKTKSTESSATPAQSNQPALRSVLLTPIKFDPDLYPEGGGKLKVRIDIDESGTPIAVTKISQQPKGFNPEPFLDTILLARFIPSERDGALVANTIVVEISLKLEQETFRFQSTKQR